MSEEIGESKKGERKTLPIERGFPIEQVNDIAKKEGYGGARQWYRPIYTMHKWWARRMGSVFRAITLYSLLDDPNKAEIIEKNQNESLSNYSSTGRDLETLISSVDLESPDKLWELYPEDIRVSDKKVLDPFMGGGTSLVEASRFGAQVDGRDLNPVAWFATKKELETGETSVEELEDGFGKVESAIKSELKSYYKTSCPNDNHTADVMNYFWVKEVDCTSCSATVQLFTDYRVAAGRYENDDKYHVYCPDCDNVVLVDDWQSESECSSCGNQWVPKEGTAGRGSYSCQECGQKYRVTDAIQEQGGFGLRLYALEYHCPDCENRSDMDKSQIKSYKSIREEDRELYQKASEEWESSPELNQYVPDEDIPEGHMTSTRNPVFDHGYQKWSDMYSDRQLLCLAKLLEAIDEVEDQNIKEYLLLAASDMLNYKSMMISYKLSSNQVNPMFKTNSFDPPLRPAEGNIWGAEYGTGVFHSVWEMVKRGVKYGNAPTERYMVYPDSEEYPSTPRDSTLSEPEVRETEPFEMPIGSNAHISQGDSRKIKAKNEYDAIITDPPYYDNIMYSEVADYFYVWQKTLLSDEYDWFKAEKTPRGDSIVVNPHLDKTAADFESELHEAFTVLRRAIKEDGVLAFTYHHSDSESWGELLEALCDVGFEVTATYPISADISKFISGEAVEFDIIIIARPADEREAISWNSLRRNIYRTAQKTRTRLEQSQNLSRGDIGVVEMGRCFHEYSKHHGKVERAGETMTAKEIVDEIYGVIQHGSDIGEIDVFLDLLETPNASFDDLKKLCRGTNATSERIKDMRLYRIEDDFTLGTWDDEKRIVYIQSRVNSDEELTDLDKAQFLRYRWEQGKSVSEYLSEWDITDDLRELCEGLADATGDDTYRNILESRLSDF